MPQQCIDAMDVEVGTHIPLVLGLGGGWIGQSAGFPSLSLPWRAGELSSSASAAYPGQSAARSAAPDQVPRFDPLID